MFAEHVDVRGRLEVDRLYQLGKLRDFNDVLMREKIFLRNRIFLLHAAGTRIIISSTIELVD